MKRLWHKIKKVGDCWEWQGARTEKGYGRLSINNRDKRAHRVAWELTYGPIPQGLLVCHHCDNPSCINPNHLFIGTHQDNINDAIKKGFPNGWSSGGQSGEKHPQAKLNIITVKKMRELHKKGMTERKLAKMFHIGRTQAHRVVARIHWKDI